MKREFKMKTVNMNTLHRRCEELLSGKTLQQQSVEILNQTSFFLTWKLEFRSCMEVVSAYYLSI